MSRASLLGWAVAGLVAFSAGCADEPVTRVDVEAGVVSKDSSAATADAEKFESATACELPGNARVLAGQTMIPDGVLLVGHVDTQAYADGPLGKMLAVGQRESTLFEAMRSCDLPPEALTSLDFGLRSPTETVLVVTAPGVGKTKTLECMHAELGGDAGESPWEFEREACPPALHAEDDRVHAYPASRDQLVVATGGWSTQVAARVRGEGTAAVEGAIAPLVAQVDRSGALWGVAQFPPFMDQALAGSALEGMRHATLGVDLSDGLEARGELAFADDVRASVWTADIDRLRKQLGARVELAELPASLSDAIAVERQRERVRVHATIDARELEALMELTEVEHAARLRKLLWGEVETTPAEPAPAPPTPEQTGSPKGDIFAHACKRDDADSCFSLAAMYARGGEVQADGTQAVALYQRACQLGHGQACELVGS